jgi:excisionase family DNA binding protein
MVSQLTVKQQSEVLGMGQATIIPDVLTLEEAADYLRLPEETIERQAAQGQIPGRRIEDTWRFLKAAIDDWLRSYDSRTLLLQQAGALAKDETLHELRATIYDARGRPEVEEEGADS